MINSQSIANTYYRCKECSCLDYFAGRTIFKGGRVIAFSKNQETESHVKKYSTIVTPIFRQVAKKFGFSLEGPPPPKISKGICHAMAVDFAVQYRKQGLQKAANQYVEGASAEVGLLQAQYEYIRKQSPYYFPDVFNALVECLENPNQQFEEACQKHRLKDQPLLKGLFLLTKLYVLKGKPGNYLEFIQKELVKKFSNLEGTLYVTVKKVDFHLQNHPEKGNDHHLDREKIIGALAGLRDVTQVMENVSAKEVCEFDFSQGIYEIGVPTYSHLGNFKIFFVFFLIFLLGLPTLIEGPMITQSIHVQPIGLGLIGIGVIGMIINQKRVREGYHGVLFIKEKDQFILFDPNYGTVTHHDGKQLLTNLFEHYIGDVHSKDIQEIDILKIDV